MIKIQAHFSGIHNSIWYKIGESSEISRKNTTIFVLRRGDYIFQYITLSSL